MSAPTSPYRVKASLRFGVERTIWLCDHCATTYREIVYARPADPLTRDNRTCRECWRRIEIATRTTPARDIRDIRGDEN